MIRTMNLVTPTDGSPASLVEPADMAAFNETHLRPHQLESVRVLDVDGALYVLHPACGKGPLPLYDAAADQAQAETEDAAIAALPEQLRQKFAPGWEPLAIRRAKKLADDAEAEVRRLEATKAGKAALDAAKADAEAKRAAVDEARGR